MLDFLIVIFRLRQRDFYYIFLQFYSYFILNLSTISKVVSLLGFMKEKPRRSWECFRLRLKEIWSLKRVRLGYFLFLWFFFQASIFNIIMLSYLNVTFRLRRLGFYYLITSFLHILLFYVKAQFDKIFFQFTFDFKA